MKENKGSIKKIWPQGLFRFDGLSKWRNSGAQMKAIQSANLSLCNNSSRASRVAVALLAFFTIGSLFAQGAPGTIQGRILDSGTGDPMIGVTAFIREANVFGVTDIDGNYVIPDVPPGQHTVIFQMAGYETSQEVINMAAGGFEELNITMSYKTAKEVVVKAKRVNNTTAALLNKRKKAAAAQDAISSEQISKSPDSDAGDAVRRVTGISLVDGKYVYIRGLGERYTSIQLNGSTLFSPDPDKRVVPLDVFPTAVVDNLVTVKTYTADLPGMFGGGMLEINSKEYPPEQLAEVKIQTGFDSLTTGKNFRSYSGGDLDWLGFEDGTRAIPSIAANNNLNNLTAEQKKIAQQSFNNSYWAASEATAGLPSSLTGTYGNSYNLGVNKLGFLITAVHKRKFKNRQKKIFDYNSNNVLLAKQLINKSEYETSKAAMLTSTFQLGSANKLRYTGLYLNISSDKQNKISQFDDESSFYSGFETRFVESSILFNQLIGQHYFENLANTTFKWAFALSSAEQKSPDQRSYKYTVGYSSLPSDPNDFSQPTGTLKLSTAGDGLTRLFESHKETGYDFRPALEVPFKQWNGLMAKAELGAQLLQRKRSSDNKRYSYSMGNLSTSELQGSIESITSNNNQDPTSGLVMNDLTTLTDNYNGEQTVIAPYMSVDLPLLARLRGVLGVKYETSAMKVTAIDKYTLQESATEDNTASFLPSLNLIYSIDNKTNLRLSGSQTVTRPDFKEKSPFEYTANLGTLIIQGNPNLTESKITNADLRYEIFPSSNSIFAVSSFFKYIDQPIESVAKSSASQNRIESYQNGKTAYVSGGEIEFRSDLAFIDETVSAISVFGNASYIYSSIRLDSGSDNTNRNRALQGQSPILFNFGVDYEVPVAATQLTLLYYYIGERISGVGINGVGDIFEKPQTSLDFVLKQPLWQGGLLKFSVSNILNSDIEFEQDDQIIEIAQRGLEFKTSYEQKF